MGLLDEDIVEIMNSSNLVFTDNGRVNYTMILNNTQFKEIKYSYHARMNIFGKGRKEASTVEKIVDDEKRSTIFYNQKVVFHS